jgi:hypothetical protein
MAGSLPKTLIEPCRRFPGYSAAARCGLLAGALIALAGCGHPTQRALQGRWLGDTVENFDEEVAAAATGWAKGTSFEFAGSSLTVAIPAEEPRTGSYTVQEVTDRSVRLAVLDSQGESSELVLLLDDERSLRWVLGDGRSVVMHRQ